MERRLATSSADSPLAHKRTTSKPDKSRRRWDPRNCVVKLGSRGESYPKTMTPNKTNTAGETSAAKNGTPVNKPTDPRLNKDKEGTKTRKEEPNFQKVTDELNAKLDSMGNNFITVKDLISKAVLPKLNDEVIPLLRTHATQLGEMELTNTQQNKRLASLEAAKTEMDKTTDLIKSAFTEEKQKNSEFASKTTEELRKLNQRSLMCNKKGTCSGGDLARKMVNYQKAMKLYNDIAGNVQERSRRLNNFKVLGLLFKEDWSEERKINYAFKHLFSKHNVFKNDDGSFPKPTEIIKSVRILRDDPNYIAQNGRPGLKGRAIVTVLTEAHRHVVLKSRRHITAESRRIDSARTVDIYSDLTRIDSEAINRMKSFDGVHSAFLRSTSLIVRFTNGDQEKVLNVFGKDCKEILDAVPQPIPEDFLMDNMENLDTTNDPNATDSDENQADNSTDRRDEVPVGTPSPIPNDWEKLASATPTME